ncbi:MAG: hypothetical protein ACKOPB_06495, partial [Actinomycetota bacterium]
LAAQVDELQQQLDELLAGTDDTVAPSTSEAPASTDAATTTAAPSGKPAAPDASSLVKSFGDIGVVSLPAGDPGVVAIVAATLALDSSGSLPVIVRNNTSKPIGTIDVTGIARDAAGNLAGSGSSQGFDPAIVQPGEIAFGYVYFGDVAGEGLTFELSATGEEPSTFFSSVPVQVTELNVGAEQIIGVVTNGSGDVVSGPISVDGVCFSPDGQLERTISGYTEQDELPAGATGSFSISLYSGPCSIGLLAASGYSF